MVENDCNLKIVNKPLSRIDKVQKIHSNKLDSKILIISGTLTDEKGNILLNKYDKIELIKQFHKLKDESS